MPPRKSAVKNSQHKTRPKIKSKTERIDRRTTGRKPKRNTTKKERKPLPHYIAPKIVAKSSTRTLPRKFTIKPAVTKPKIRTTSTPSQPNYVLGFVTRALEQRWTQYETVLKQFQIRPTRKAVHDLRVAIRRLTAILDLIQKFIPQSNVNAAQAKLNDQVTGLSDLRDVQVKITAIRRILKQFPELKGFYKTLLDDEKVYLRHSSRLTMPPFVSSLDSAVGRINISLNARRSILAPDSAQKILEAAIDNAFELVAKRLKDLNPVDYATIHRVRLAFKPFRYLLEAFHPLLPTIDTKQVRSALWLAGLMGNIQDSEVLMKNLVEYKWENGQQRKAMMEIWQETEVRRNQTTRRLLSSLDKFSGLWKPVPQQVGQPSKMRTIYVLRHAIAVQRGDPGYPMDSDRPLTAKGVRRMRRIANGMRGLGVEFDLILTSPYRRALETAFVLARQFRSGEAIQTTPMLTPETAPENLLQELISKYGACRDIVIVGHEPQLSAIISTLTSGTVNSPPLLKKGGLCKLQIMKLGSEKPATLSWLLTPKQLLAMA